MKTIPSPQAAILERALVASNEAKQSPAAKSTFGLQVSHYPNKIHFMAKLVEETWPPAEAITEVASWVSAIACPINANVSRKVAASRIKWPADIFCLIISPSPFSFALKVAKKPKRIL